MRELYNTASFVSCKIEDNRPIPGEFQSYCSYCKEDIIIDYTFDEYTRYDYKYCNCKMAELEKEYKEKIEVLERKHNNEIYDLKRGYETQGVIIGDV